MSWLILKEMGRSKEIRNSQQEGQIMLRRIELMTLVLALGLIAASSAYAGTETTNGWYEGEEIYYINIGMEEGVTERGPNQIYLIGGNRRYQANVVLHIPGEPGYSPHWNVNVVYTAEGVTLGDILASPYVSEHYESEGVLFDDVEDILDAEEAGLVTIDHPGIVVLCPIISEMGAEAPGNIQLSEDFPPFPDTFPAP
jgi:hypothetical protein